MNTGTTVNKYYIYIVFVAVFLLNAVVAIQQRTIFLSTDEMGVVASSAFLVGEDWSGIVSEIPYYGFGQALLYTPIYLLSDNHVVRAVGMGLINSLLVALIFPISYHIFRAYLGCSNKQAICFGVLAVMFPSYTTYSKWVWNESMLCVLPWIILWVILGLFYTTKYKIALSIVLGFLCIYSYAVHGRGIALAVTAIAIVLLMWVLSKKLLISFVPFLVSTILSYGAYKWMYKFLTVNLWKVSEGQVLNNTMSSSLARFEQFLQPECIYGYFKTLSGAIYAISCSTFGLALFFLVYVCYVCYVYMRRTSLRGLYGSYHIETQNSHKSMWMVCVAYTLIFTVVAVGISTISLNGGLGDYLIYTRYYANALGMVAVFTVYILWKQYLTKKQLVFSFILTIVIYGCSLIIVQDCAFGRPYVYTNLFPFLHVGCGYELMVLNVVMLFITVFLFLLLWNQKWKLAYIAILCLCIYSYGYCVKYVILPSYQNSQNEVIHATLVLEQYDRLYEEYDKIYYYNIDDRPNSASGLQFNLPRYYIERIDDNDLTQKNLEKNSLIIATTDISSKIVFDDCYQLSTPTYEGAETYIYVYGSELKEYMETRYQSEIVDKNSILGALSSQVDVEGDNTIISNGDAGYLLYGPYTTYESGTYELTITGQVNESTESHIGSFDVVSGEGKNSIVSQISLEDFVEGNDLELNQTITLNEITELVEFRVYVTEGTILEIEDVQLERVA